MRPFLVVACCLAVIGCTAPQDQLVPPANPRVDEIEPGLAKDVAKIQARWWSDFHDPQLDHMMDLALAQSPSLQAAGARLAEAQAVATSQQASLLPQVGFSAQIDEQQFSQNYIFVPGMKVYNGYGFIQANLNWSLDIWGKQRKHFDAAVTRSKAAALDIEAAKLLLSSSLAKVYIDLDRAHKLKSLNGKELALRDRLLQIALARQTAGLNDAIEAKQRLADRDLAQARLTQSDLAIKVLQHQLAALAHQGPSWGEQLRAPSLEAKTADLPAAIPADLLGRRPDLQALLEQITAAGIDLEAAKLEYLPDVNLQGYAGVQSIGLSTLLQGASQTFSIGPAINLPIFDGGRIAANALGKEAIRNERISAYQEQLVSALKEAADGIASVKNTATELVQMNKTLLDTQSYWRITQQRKNVGLTTADAVLSAELNVVQQEKQVLDTQARSMSAKISLIQALGGSFEITPDHPASEAP